MAELWKDGYGNANFALEDFRTRGMPHTMEPDEEASPVTVGLLGARAIALYAHGGLHALHQLRQSAARIYMAALGK